MSSLRKIEKESGFTLPEVYKDFYWLCSSSTPDKLVGTDLLNEHPDLQEGAAQLLADDGADHFLAIDDFVFMMHQGYMFWYFKANGDPDPIVYGYREGRRKVDTFERFTIFLLRSLLVK